MATCANISCINQWSSNETHCPNCQALSINSLVGYRYQIKKMLGKGGFSITYLVQDLDCFKEVRVLKQLKLLFDNNNYDPETNEIAERLFKREAEVLLKLKHPGIPKLYAYFIDQGYSYLVQDFIPGKTLAEEVIERNYPFDEKEARALLVELAEILEYLHTHNPIIIHRDIKPENLMRHESGKILLIDFGAVCQSVENHPNKTLIYTPGYTAPEQIAGNAVTQSDLYSVGATILRLLTSESISSAIKPKEGQWEPFINVSKEFASIINDLLIPDPNKRLHSAGELKWRLQLLPPLPKIVGNPISPRPQYISKTPNPLSFDCASLPTLFNEQEKQEKDTNDGKTSIEFGNLKEQPFIFLLQRILRDGLSGSLICTNEKVTKNIVFHQGNIIAANSTEIIDQLNDLVIRISNIAPSDFQQARDEMFTNSCSFSEALLRLKIISPTELKELHTLQISQIALSLFNWQSGQYELRCESINILPNKASLPIIDLVFKAIRKLEDSCLLKSWLGDFSRTVILNPIPNEITKTINLTPKEAFILSRISTNISIAELLLLNCLPELEVLKALCGLLVVGLLKWSMDEKKTDHNIDSIGRLLNELHASVGIYNFQNAAMFCYEVESIMYSLDNINYYALLGVSAYAKDSEIRQAYMEATKKFHPEANAELCKYNLDLAPKLEKLYSYICSAYRVLSNPFTKKQYDSRLRLNRTPLSCAK
ncbi:MAG: protein kinase [Blastocatellia bacterium]|nr:protein kinase [Blastocatellia bacterium]MBL8194902.1 protein kinase [Blastocatellia bacterium]